MTVWTLSEVERAVRAGWGEDTCVPEDLPKWHPGNPARGQCGVTALVLHDLLGGSLVRGEVRVAGERVDYHWWNRFGTGLEVDLTREQFAPEERGVGGVAIERPPEIRRMREEYELLRADTERSEASSPLTARGFSAGRAARRPAGEGGTKARGTFFRRSGSRAVHQAWAGSWAERGRAVPDGRWVTESGPRHAERWSGRQ